METRHATSRHEASPTIDHEVLAELRSKVGRPVIVGLVEIFADRAELLDELVRVSQGPNCDELVRIAHEIHDGASAVAATRLAELAAELEECGRAHRAEDAHRLALQTAAEYDRALAELDVQLESRRPRRRFPPRGVRRG